MWLLNSIRKIHGFRVCQLDKFCFMRLYLYQLSFRDILVCGHKNLFAFLQIQRMENLTLVIHSFFLATFLCELKKQLKRKNGRGFTFFGRTQVPSSATNSNTPTKVYFPERIFFRQKIITELKALWLRTPRTLWGRMTLFPTSISWRSMRVEE